MKKLLFSIVMIFLSMPTTWSCLKNDPASPANGKGTTQNNEIASMYANMPAADKTGMSSDAFALAAKLSIGWNLGNSLEAYDDGTDPTASETSWRNPITTKEMIDSVAAAGFKTVRIPVRWYPHMTEQGDTIHIDAKWLARVKEVVQYCLNDGLYVIINTHHELWLENHPFYADSASIYQRERKLWTQIATVFRNYDEHLLFAGTNEVHLSGTNAPGSPENYAVQNGYNQIFVNTVRATGGKNAYRNLIVQTYRADANWGTDPFKIPTDVTPNRMMIEVHYYDPWNYCGMDSTKFWGAPYKAKGVDKDGQEADMEKCFAKLKTLYVDKGYPVIMGEYGVVRHSAPSARLSGAVRASRAYYLGTLVQKTLSKGIIPFFWDNGYAGIGEDQFALFNRRDHMKQVDASAIAAIMKSVKTNKVKYRNR